MTEQKPSHTQYAAPAHFPRTLFDLQTTARCPACFEALTSTLCRVCKLDLSHPSAVELAATSTEAAELLEHRMEIIGRIRYESSRTSSPNLGVAAAAALAVPAPAFSAPAIPVPAVALAGAGLAQRAASGAAAAPTVAAPQVSAQSGAPSAILGSQQPEVRSGLNGIQLFLLLGGITLLSLASIAFLIFAFVNSGLLLRSVIIAVFTAAMFALASFLRHRKLGGTAEGIAVFAAVLVYLDAWAIRGNNLAGAGLADGVTYWGFVLVLSSAGFLLWHRLSGFRTPSIIAFAALVPGVGMITYGFADALESPTRVYLAALVASLAGLSHFAVPRVSGPNVSGPVSRARAGALERIFALTLAAISLTVASFIAGFISPESFWAGTVALAGVALVGLIHSSAHVLALNRMTAMRVSSTDNPDALPSPAPDPAPASAPAPAPKLDGLRGFGHYFAALGATTAALALVPTLASSPGIEFATTVPLIAAICVAGLLDVAQRLLTRRRAESASVGMTRTATRAAAVIAAIFALAPVAISLTTVLVPVTRAVTVDLWNKETGDVLSAPAAESTWSVLALALALVVTFVFSAAAGRLATRAVALSITAGVIILTAVALTAMVWTMVGGWMLVAASGIFVWCVNRARSTSAQVGSLRNGLVTVALVAGLAALALGYTASWASADSWLVGTAMTVVAIFVIRWAVGPAAIEARIGASIVGALLILLGSWAFAQWLVIGGGTSFEASVFNGARALSITSLLLVLALAFTPQRFIKDAERRSLFWLTGLTLLLTVSTTTTRYEFPTGLLLPEPLSALLVSTAAIVVVAVWSFGRVSARLIPERSLSTFLLVPALYAALASLIALATADVASSAARDGIAGFAIALAPAIATLLGVALSLGLALSLPRIGMRWLRDAGATFVAAVALISVVWHPGFWIALIILAVAALVVAVDRTGLFAAHTPRKHVGWLALASATTGLWTLLAKTSFTAPEPYVLPLAGALLAIAALVWNSQRTRSATPEGSSSGDYESAQPSTRVPTTDLTVATLTFGGLIIAILPIAIVSAEGSSIRTAVVGIASAVLLIAASYAPSRATASPLWRSGRPYRDAIALAGVVGVVTTMLGRLITMLGEPGIPDAWFDVVLVSGALTLAIAAFGRFQPGVRTIFAAASIALVALFEMATLIGNFGWWAALEPIAEARMIALVLYLSAIYVIATVKNSAPLTAQLGAGSLTLAAIAGVAGLASRAITPLEVATVPVAVALIVGGAVTLRRVATSRSWQTIGVGMALFIVPSLLATIIDRPFWRVLAIAIVAIVFVIVGQVAKLQAPFVIGTIVIVVHGLATFSPQIRAVFEAGGWLSWIIVAALGGTILTVFAARTERSVKSARGAIAKITQLR